MNYKVLYHHDGVNSNTAMSPVKVFEESDKPMLSHTKKCCLYHDDDRLVEVNAWAVFDVTLPDWMSPEEWIRNHVQWTFLWHGRPEIPTWPESWQRWLVTLGEAPQQAVYKLLNTKKFRSEFREKMANQIKEWLDTPEADRHYKFPLSHNQAAAIISQRDAWDARARGESIYYHLRYNEAKGI